MYKHWQYTEVVGHDDYQKFLKHNAPLKSAERLLPNTAVYVQCETGSQRLEGIYDDALKAIRPLRSKNPDGKDAPNRDLRLYNDAMQNKNITIMGIDGLMGTGKTSTVVEWTIEQHLKGVDVPKNAAQWENWKPPVGSHKVLVAKPNVNAGGKHEQYGFLPGDLDDKLDPTLRNFIQYFDRWHESGFNALRDAGYIELSPLGFIRGMDAEDVTLIVDECQNTKELVTPATRRAKGSRIIFLGDTSPFQIDLMGNTPKRNGLRDIIDLLQGAPYFQYIEMKSLEHVVRSDEVRDIVRRLFKKHGADPQEWTI